MANMTTDVTPILQAAFPNGKPEMSAADFDKAHKFVMGRRNGSVLRPAPGFSMDYAFWAHCMIVEWRLRVDQWEKTNKVMQTLSAKGVALPGLRSPTDLICPQCDVKCVLDMSAGDVLVCPGGCHRAITVNTFVQLFKPAGRSIARTTPPALTTSRQSTRTIGTPLGGLSGLGSATRPASPAGLAQTVPKGARPEDYGIYEKPKKSKKPLVGWRMWSVMPNDMGRLLSLNSAGSTSWLPMTPQRGTCMNQDPSEISDHVCPSWEHRCGVHAVKELSQVRKWGAPLVGPRSAYVRVLGEVDLWGRVLEYAEGYRAEWGYPKKLYLPERLPDVFDCSAQELADSLWMSYLTEVEINQAQMEVP